MKLLCYLPLSGIIPFLTKGATLDLDEYLFYEKKKSKDFSDTKFSQQLGYSKSYFSRVLTKKITPGAHFLYALDKLTDGKVDILKMLREAYKDKG